MSDLAIPVVSELCFPQKLFMLEIYLFKDLSKILNYIIVLSIIVML